MFDRNVFDAAFDKSIKALAKAEKLTKETVRDLSREVLTAVQETEDIGYVNRLLDVLTPMNRKTCVLFYREFSGFTYTEDVEKFTKKDKKHYDDVKAKALAALDDPHFNVWTWAERNVSIEAKPFDLKKVTAFATNAIKKANAEGITQMQILEAFFAAGFEAEVIVQILDKLADKTE